MTVSYDFYTSDSRSATFDGTGKITWGDIPKTSGIELWHGPVEFRWGYPVTANIPVIRRKPKKDLWEKYVESMKEIRDIKDITEVTRHIEVRPVIICGWCGGRYHGGKKMSHVNTAGANIKCKTCGRKLSNPKSLRRQYGPTCWKRKQKILREKRYLKKIFA